MKRLLVLSVLVALAGCSTVKEYWPRSHDPALMSSWVNVDLKLEKLNCENKDENAFDNTIADALWMGRYALARQDPQQTNANAIADNVTKAKNTKNLTVCKRWIELARERQDILRKSWGSR